VAEAVTASPEAARWYYAGVDCMENARGVSSPWEVCAGNFERALALDPAFPLAHYRLAYVRSIFGTEAGEGGRHIDAALRGQARLGERERLLAEALAHRIEGHADEARRRYDAVLLRWSDDLEALDGAGEVLWRAGRWAESVPYYERVVALVPEREASLTTLIEALGRLGRREDLVALRDRLMARPDSSSRRRGLGSVNQWLGDPDAAWAEARRAYQLRGREEAALLVETESARGNVSEAQSAARFVVDPWTRRVAISRALASQGRVREALSESEAAYAQLRAAEGEQRHFAAAHLAAVAWDGERVWRHAAKAFAVDPAFAADLAVLLALLGDLEHARLLGQHLVPGSLAAEELVALEAWRAGKVTEALSRLTAIEARDAWPAYGIAPAYLAAEVSAAAGDDRETLSAVQRYLRLPPRGSYRTYAFLRSLYLTARAHRNLGDPAAALEVADRLVRLLARADPDVPLARDARALRVSLRANRVGLRPSVK
jgi:hypothetical protein